MKSEVLVIGYGNTLRGDDGIGPYVAQRLQQDYSGSRVCNLRVLAVHQLTPELAQTIAESQVKMVIFIDAIAHRSQTQPTIEKLEPKNTVPKGHTLEPSQLLYLSDYLYGHLPQGYWVLMPGVNFEFGETFSEVTTNSIESCLNLIRKY
ncbi:MAG: hydrogenase maturation protease [Synechococcaceae cyanobacterium RL_1_2]|nr:hydrogenase maturation protease [Synechococcaceae cyanobacterium RL_1_2]